MRTRWKKGGSCRNGSGWTQTRFDAAWTKQQGRCAICNDPLDDCCTDHTVRPDGTPHPRGLICRQCNFGLGLFKDNFKVLMSAAHYVLEHRPVVMGTLGRPILGEDGASLEDSQGNKLEA
jgi:hypothetical protein